MRVDVVEGTGEKRRSRRICTVQRCQSVQLLPEPPLRLLCLSGSLGFARSGMAWALEGHAGLQSCLDVRLDVTRLEHGLVQTSSVSLDTFDARCVHASEHAALRQTDTSDRQRHRRVPATKVRIPCGHSN